MLFAHGKFYPSRPHLAPEVWSDDDRIGICKGFWSEKNRVLTL